MVRPVVFPRLSLAAAGRINQIRTMKKELNEQEARYKAEAYCSLTEHCVSEVENKLEQWGVAADVAARIIAHLLKERYVDLARFSAAFVRDKYRFNQWGRIKIGQALRMKQIPADVIAESLAAIDEDEYLEILRSLMAQKRKSVKGRSEYERSVKLMRFAIGRGFEMEAVRRCLKQLGGTDEADDLA